jgi:hypothetical protein
MRTDECTHLAVSFHKKGSILQVLRVERRRWSRVDKASGAMDAGDEECDLMGYDDNHVDGIAGLNNAVVGCALQSIPSVRRLRVRTGSRWEERSSAR